MSAEIVLKAQKTQRRAEDALGRAVRRGQEAGEIADRSVGAAVRDQRLDATLVSPSEFFSNAKEKTDIYAMADAPAEDVERALRVAIRKGQEVGEILSAGQRSDRTGHALPDAKSVREFVPHGQEIVDIYAMTDGVRRTRRAGKAPSGPGTGGSGHEITVAATPESCKR